jgi:ribosomal protein S15P/S13E
LIVAGWLQRRREEYIAYLLAENAVYKEHFAKRGLRLTDAQRRRLAVKPQGGGKSAACPYRNDRHARHHLALVPSTRRAEVRWQP